jgi:serine/threonine protein phosphatase PrpC
MELCQFQGNRYISYYPTSQDSYSYRNVDGIKITGVYDGHGKYGHLVSRQVSIELPPLLVESIKKEDFLSIPHIFYRYALSLRNQKIFHSSGTTACIVIETLTTLYVFNTGDSAAIWESEGIAITSSIISMKDDSYRLAKFPYITIKRGRVNGTLNMPRSIGNFDLTSKEDLMAGEMVISPNPEITVVEKKYLSKPYYLLVSDGITDVLNASEIMSLATDINDVCYTAKKRGSNDDVTAIKVTLSQVYPLAISGTVDTFNIEDNASVIEGVTEGTMLKDWNLVKTWSNGVFSPPEINFDDVEAVFLSPDDFGPSDPIDEFLLPKDKLKFVEKYFVPSSFPSGTEVMVSLPNNDTIIILNLGNEIIVNDALILKSGQRSIQLSGDVGVKFSQNDNNEFLVYHY